MLAKEIYKQTVHNLQGCVLDVDYLGYILHRYYIFRPAYQNLLTPEIPDHYRNQPQSKNIISGFCLVLILVKLHLIHK